MKKIIAIVCFCLFFVFLFCIVFYFCRQESKNENEVLDRNVKIITTIFPQYDFLKQLTKDVDGVEVAMLSSPGVDVHCFEPSPKDIKNIKSADMFVYVGGKNDSWVEKILDSIEDKKCKTVSLFEILKGRENLKDEHVWTSVLNCIKIVEFLGEKLCEIDKNNKEKYLENTKEYVEKLKELDREFKEVVSNKKRDFVVFADKFPFTYLFDDYKIDSLKAFHNCSSKSEVSSFEIAKIIEKAKANKIKFILKTEGTTDDSVAKTIMRETGAKILTLNSCHTCSKKDFEKGKTFLEFYRENLKTLKEALS